MLDREGLPRAELESPFVGTFPTFLVGGLVVKLFGETFDGGDAFAAELAMGELLAGVPEVPAPAVVASGRLFEDGDGWSWPYLILERLTARAVRDVPSVRSLRRAAEQLGPALARLHTLPAPPMIAQRDPLPRLRADSAGPAPRLRPTGPPGRAGARLPRRRPGRTGPGARRRHRRSRLRRRRRPGRDHRLGRRDHRRPLVRARRPPLRRPPRRPGRCSRSCSTPTAGPVPTTSGSEPCKASWSSSSTRSPPSPAPSTLIDYRPCTTSPTTCLIRGDLGGIRGPIRLGSTCASGSLAGFRAEVGGSVAVQPVDQEERAKGGPVGTGRVTTAGHRSAVVR